jgi:hypothetical protein
MEESKFLNELEKPIEDEETLSLVREVQNLRASAHRYADILRSLASQGLNSKQCPHVFSRAYGIPYGHTKAINYWNPEIDTSWQDDKIDYEINSALSLE